MYIARPERSHRRGKHSDGCYQPLRYFLPRTVRALQPGKVRRPYVIECGGGSNEGVIARDAVIR